MQSIESLEIGAVLDSLRQGAGYEGQIVEIGVAEPREAQFGEPERPLPDALRQRLFEAGIEKLYTHQATAFDLAEAGMDTVVTSGTSSGKTLCYNLPVLSRLLGEPAARALYLFPTKALAQDQLGKLAQLVPAGIRAATYDGDTPKSQRAAIRGNAHIVLTNPDMLHLGILPNHPMWARFLKNLRFIVLDEMHAYSGVFGSHVALILRRLLRLCEWLGSSPRVISCSATIRNPLELFGQLTGREAELVDQDGAPYGTRYLVMWNPPEVAEGLRRSPNTESAQLFGGLVCRGARTIAFARSRITAELILRYTREGVAAVDPSLVERIESYRAGYTPEDRRGIERRLFTGELRGLSSTDAMELGVDVGTLDAIVMNGYPGSISSLRQQAGRAGRSGRDALAVMVAHNDPLDQYYLRHPQTLLGGIAEAVRVHPSNPFILAQQLRCAAHERPLAPTELEGFPPESLQVLEALEDAGLLVRRSGMWFHPRASSPAAEVDIRGNGNVLFSLETRGETLGSMEEWRAFYSAHPGAIYLHRGSQYFVRAMDMEQNLIEVEPVRVEYYTQSFSETSVLPTTTLQSGRLGSADICLDGVRVTTQVTGFRRKSLADDSVLSLEDLELPPTTIDTVGVRLDLPPPPRGQEWLGGVHALEHLLVALAPTIAHCEPRDLGSAYYGIWPDTGRPAVYVFDSVPGGIGLSETLFLNAGEWLERVAEQLSACPCAEGCPACILSPRCPYANEDLDKSAALQILRTVLG